jgi:hypothetical protein
MHREHRVEEVRQANAVRLGDEPEELQVYPKADWVSLNVNP